MCRWGNWCIKITLLYFSTHMYNNYFKSLKDIQCNGKFGSSHVSGRTLQTDLIWVCPRLRIWDKDFGGDSRNQEGSSKESEKGRREKPNKVVSQRPLLLSPGGVESVLVSPDQSLELWRLAFYLFWKWVFIRILWRYVDRFNKQKQCPT